MLAPFSGSVRAGQYLQLCPSHPESAFVTADRDTTRSGDSKTHDCRVLQSSRHAHDFAQRSARGTEYLPYRALSSIRLAVSWPDGLFPSFMGRLAPGRFRPAGESSAILARQVHPLDFTTTGRAAINTEGRLRMFISESFDSRGETGSSRNTDDEHSPGWGAWLAIFEVLAGVIYLFSPAIAAGKVAVLTGMNIERAVEFVVGMLGVALATIVRNRMPNSDERSET
jgi:hypothetical protein